MNVFVYMRKVLAYARAFPYEPVCYEFVAVFFFLIHSLWLYFGFVSSCLEAAAVVLTWLP